MSYSGKFKDKNNNLHPVTSVLYGTCDTAAATAAKVVTCADFDTLMTGVTIRVKFDNANTAASPTVNINSTGAKSVYRFGSTAPVDGDSWKAGEVVDLLYDGTSFFMVGADDIGSKQDALTFDDTPTDGSNNPVKSNGIYDSEKDIYATMGEMGAKNLIPYPYYEASGKDNRGVVFTYGNDGIVYMNGTSEQSLQPFLSLQTHLTLNPANILDGHSYILYCDSDSPYVFSVIYFKNGSNIQVNLAFSYEYSDGETGTTTQNYISLLKGGVVRKWVKFTVTSGNASTSQIDIRVDQGSHQVNNAYGKVMFIDGRDTDLTWKIFAKTNKQLTDDVASLESEKADTDMVAADFNAGTSYTAGNYCVQDGKLYRFKNNHSGAWSAADVDEVKIAGELSSLKNGLTNVSGKVPVKGFFGVACAAGLNTFNRNTMTLTSGSLPTSTFRNCIMGIIDHTTALNSPNYIETDSNDVILINSVSAQTLTVIWLDLSNIPDVTVN